MGVAVNDRPPPTGTPALRAKSPAHYGLTAWFGAGLLGMTAAVTMAIVGPFEQPGTFMALACTMSGWLVMMAFAPWRRVLSWRDQHHALHGLELRLRRVIDDGDEAAITELREHGGDDPVGRVSRTAHDLLRETVANRRAAQRMHRTLGDSIRRETHRQTARLRREAATDPLTGLGNRRALDHAIATLLERDARGEDLVVALVADLDDFKVVNDRLGHAVGDRCLEFVGQMLRSSVRREDTAIRLGGDEFVVLMPGQTLGAAERLAERLCAMFRQMPWPHRDTRRPGLSVGLGAVSMQELGDGSDLLAEADEALYLAKRMGGSRVERVVA
ncbi:MAG: GGDEF domain-containing protein [Planctomycetota bacterium]|jgi:diguanylate cyclase (GGDEF)-like protein